MGNSVRHTLSHICGGESSKEVQHGDQPVDRPKQSKKKKSKKKKKNRKSENAKLGSSDLSNEGQTLLEEDGNQQEPAVINELNDEKSSNKDLVNSSEPTKYDDVSPIQGDEKIQRPSQTSTVPLITVDLVSDASSISSDNQNESQVFDEDEEDGSVASVSLAEEVPKASVLLNDFQPIKGEESCIEEADRLFEVSALAYEKFVVDAKKLQGVVKEFQNTFDGGSLAEDLVTLWQLYIDSTSKNVLHQDGDGVLKCILAAEEEALSLKSTIEDVKPVLSKCAEDAKTLDVIQCTKDAIRDGDEVMHTDKFSAPGRHRRNMVLLRKCFNEINDIEIETNQILLFIHDYLVGRGMKRENLNSEFLNIRESLIFPEEIVIDKHLTDLDDLFSSLSKEEDEETLPLMSTDDDDDDNDDTLPIIDDSRPHTPLPPVDHGLNRSGSSQSCSDRDVYIKVYYESDESCSGSTSNMDDEHIRTVSVSLDDLDLVADRPLNHVLPEDDQTHTFLIKSVPEINDPLSQLTSTPRRCHTPPCLLDAEPDHNTLEYGNYVFVDPSTGDIQVMRNRSRSLDSLVSMASSRSSISRFGSFEFVTDFEINIAEKNQEKMNTK